MLPARETPGAGRLLPNTWWVIPGRVLAGEYPGAPTPAETRSRLRALLDQGIGCFLDLTEPDELAPYSGELPVSADYLRKPIPDHGLPRQVEHMAEILDCIQGAARRGQAVYLHCRAGIGRTGMVAGCLLVERGLSGADALGELNRLWQQSRRSTQWPEVPETREQRQYVLDWKPMTGAPPDDPLFEPQALAAARSLRERFLGALLGLACADAVAAATQFRVPGRFAPVGDLLGGGPFDLPRGAWSDDTAMALCLAESLLARQGFDGHDQVAQYRRWQQEGHLSATGQCLGITAGTARALAAAQWRRQAFSGTHDPQALDPEVLSRVLPVVMFHFAQCEEAIEASAQAARTTSQAPQALAACRCLARALHAALSGAGKEAIITAAEPLPPLGARARASGPAGETAPRALSEALSIFGQTGNFRDAVLLAANQGGNSDVIAAVTGALAGAHYGAGAIPTSWRNSLIRHELIESYSDRLLTRAMLQMA
ncbi:MAG: ADP-ribosylglycohydrolase family protein [Proteobacteria bacterium]|nr:ADP-ribosylglycohydrolase family protein [Pseudomonadota bacterium]